MIEWRNIEEFPDYQISEDGLMRRVVGGRRRVDTITGWIYQSTGYRAFTFNRKNVGKRKHRTIHRLVAIAFLGPAPSPNHEVAHCDGNRLNNHYTNLRWCAHKENERDKIAHGTLNHSESSHLATLTVSDVLNIRERFANGATYQQLADTTNAKYHNIWNIVHRRNWKHI